MIKRRYFANYNINNQLIELSHHLPFNMLRDARSRKDEMPCIRIIRKINIFRTLFLRPVDRDDVVPSTKISWRLPLH